MPKPKESSPKKRPLEETLAIIALISAVTVAVVGVISTALSSYFTLQAVQAPIIIPLQATQTAEARLLLAAATPFLAVTPTETISSVVTIAPTHAPTFAPTFTPTSTSTLSPATPPTPTSAPTCRTRTWCALRPTGNNNDQFCEDIFELQPQLVSSISITMTKRNQPELGYSIWEVEAYESSTSVTDLISTTVDVQATSIEDDRRQPLNAIDHDKLTRWASAWSDKPDGKDPQVLVIKFPQPVIVGRMVIKWEKAYALDYCVAINSDE